MFTITITLPVALLAVVLHFWGLWVASVTVFVAMQYRAKRAEDAKEALYAQWAAEYEAEVAAHKGCYAECGECWTCRSEPDQG